MDHEISHISTPTDQAAETTSALDALFKQATDAAPSGEPTEAKPDATPAAAAAPKEEAKPAPAKETPAPAAEPAAAAVPKEDAKPEPAKPTPAADVKDDLDKVELPPYSKPKTGEAFAQVKQIARETISKKDAEIERLNKELAAREEKLKAVPSDEEKAKRDAEAKELEDLRNFRRASDIENDPEFKSSFDGKIASNNQAIVAKLTEAGLSKEQLAEIEKHGGVEKIDWDPILPNLTPAIRHYISAKLGNNIELRDQRREAVEAARKEPTKFETQRREQQAKTLTETTNSFLKKLAWTAERELPANATAEQKAEIDAHNKTAKDAQELIKTALADYAPETFAELAVGTAVALKYKADFTSLKASSDAAIAKSKIDLEAVTKERDAAVKELAAIKKAGKTHIRTTSTPAPALADPFANGSDALDRLRAESE